MMQTILTTIRLIFSMICCSVISLATTQQTSLGRPQLGESKIKSPPTRPTNHPQLTNCFRSGLLYIVMHGCPDKACLRKVISTGYDDDDKVDKDDNDANNDNDDDDDDDDDDGNDDDDDDWSGDGAAVEEAWSEQLGMC